MGDTVSGPQSVWLCMQLPTVKLKNKNTTSIPKLKEGDIKEECLGYLLYWQNLVIYIYYGVCMEEAG